MDFARRQLEKYGWSDGKGLGKHENGISEALKPKLKRSVTGVGHDPASEFNEHWWSALYDKAAKNVEVEEKNGKTKRIKTVDSDNFTISSSMWKINKKRKDKSDNGYSEYFLKKAVLDNGGSREENVSDDTDEEKEGKRDVFKMTDEELFAACEGRTAHKGARHGLKALGKLARIAEQEQKLLTQAKYEGYSHAKKLRNQNHDEVVENISMEENNDTEKRSKKKKKKKRCSNENVDLNVAESASLAERPELKSKNLDSDTSEINHVDFSRKAKATKNLDDTESPETDSNEIVEKVKKNKKRKLNDVETEDVNISEDIEKSVESDASKKKKKKKRRKIED